MGENGLCPHCGGSLATRNPSGFCDHLYYPENCAECRARGGEPDLVDEIVAESTALNSEFPAILRAAEKPKSAKWQAAWKAAGHKGDKPACRCGACLDYCGTEGCWCMVELG